MIAVFYIGYGMLIGATLIGLLLLVGWVLGKVSALLLYAINRIVG